MGWLTRKFGLTIDNLVSVEIVTADGQLRTASAQEYPDLFWAVRGGGGNFGVVTSFEFALHELDPMVQVACSSGRWSRAATRSGWPATSPARCRRTSTA